MAAVAKVHYHFAGFELDPQERRLLGNGQEHHLGPRTFDLLVTLVERRGRLVNKAELLTKVWGKAVVEENTLQAHVSVLRKVLGPDAIATVARKGYRFKLDVSADAKTEVEQSTPRHNLPYALTRFIGRREILAELGHLCGQTRLLTLTGSGGCGKTRLGVELARQQVAAHADGAWLVELAALTDPALVPQTIAGVLGLKDRQGVAWLDAVIEHLATRSLLLLIDNAEHLLDACAHLTETLLKRCERLIVVVTSRERLGITGELTFRVPSLSVPGTLGEATSNGNATSESVELFVDRVRLHQPRFELSKRNALAVGSICRQLDGIALAIELAAARVRSLSVEKLARRLDARFELLTDGSRTALPRHRTLHSLVAWSYGLLDEPEKAMLRAVSVFSGGWTLEAAEAMLRGFTEARSETLALLQSLVDKSLISLEERDGGPRYSVLETVRQYAVERSLESDERTQLLERHAAFFLATAEEANRHLSDADSPIWLEGLETERDNLRSALSWSITAPAASVRLRLVAALSMFWTIRGHLTEGRQWFTAALAEPSAPADAEARRAALVYASQLAFRQADHAVARRYAEAALGMAVQAGDPRTIARGWQNLGTVEHDATNFERATECYERALDLFRQHDDKVGIAMASCNLGQIAEEHLQLDEADRLLTHSVELLRTVGDWRLTYSTSSLGQVAHRKMDFHRAAVLYEETLAAWRKIGHRNGIAIVMASLGQLARDTGDASGALPLLREALTIQVELGLKRWAAETLAVIGEIALERGHPSTATRLWGYEERSNEILRLPRGVSYHLRPARVRALADASAVLGADAFRAAWDEGRSMTFDEALAAGFEVCE